MNSDAKYKMAATEICLIVRFIVLLYVVCLVLKKKDNCGQRNVKLFRGLYELYLNEIQDGGHTHYLL